MESMKGSNIAEDIFAENDKAVTITAVKVLRWLVLVFPLLILISVLGLFQSQVKDLVPLTLIAVAVTMGPTIAYKLNAPIGVLKYASTLALAVLIALMASNSTIGIYMTYALAMVFSIFYYDKKFTLRISVISYILLVGSLYFRSLNVQQIEFESDFVWFVSRSVGFLMEAVVMTVICVKIADVSHRMLVNLGDTRRVADLVNKCNSSSVELSKVVEDLENSVREFKTTNDAITGFARETLEDCNSSLACVDNVCDSMKNMDESVSTIASKTDQMLHVAEETSVKMKNYIVLMEQAADSMKKIESSAQMTEESITSLEDGIKEVSEFADTISGITKQTNLLALNASIEAARAGEMGRGFSVVADEVRVLADDSKKASDAITGIIQRIFGLLNEVKNSNTENLSNVSEGISQIHSASKEAEEIGDIQEKTKEMALEVSSSSGNTKKSSEKVLHMAGEMYELVQKSLNQADKISHETESQTDVTRNVEGSLNQVNKAAKDLLAISSVKE